MAVPIAISNGVEAPFPQNHGLDPWTIGEPVINPGHFFDESCFLPSDECPPWALILSHVTRVVMHSHIFKTIKPPGQSVTTDGPVARGIDQAKFDLTGPRRRTILPEIWSEPVHPGAEAELQTHESNNTAAYEAGPGGGRQRQSVSPHGRPARRGLHCRQHLRTLECRKPRYRPCFLTQTHCGHIVRGEPQYPSVKSSAALDARLHCM